MKFKPIETNPELAKLLEAAAKAPPMTPEQRREQKISFVYGQMMDCAPHLTKDDIRKQLDRLT